MIRMIVAMFLPQVEHATRTDGRIVLLNNFGYMMKRSIDTIIRFPSFHKDNNIEEFHRAKIMLYVPWRNEQDDLIADYQTFEEHFFAKQDLISHNEQKYTKPTYCNVEEEAAFVVERLDTQVPIVDVSNTPTVVTDVANEDTLSAETLFINDNAVSSHMQATFDAIAKKHQYHPKNIKVL